MEDELTLEEARERLELLEGYVLATRFPVLLLGTIFALFTLLMLAMGFFSTAMGSCSSIMMLVPVVIYGSMSSALLRSGVAGLQARSDPSKAVDVARHQETYWQIQLVFMALVLALTALMTCAGNL